MADTIKGIVQHLYNTASELAIQNVILKAGEIGLESDTLRIKIGDGVTNWNDLDYTDSLNPLDYITAPDANYSYTIRKDKENVALDFSDITEDRTLTVDSETGCNIQNKVELINNSDYRLTITKDTTTFIMSKKDVFKIYMNNNVLTRSKGWGLIYENLTPDSQFVLSTDLDLLEQFSIDNLYRCSLRASDSSNSANAYFGNYITSSAGDYRGSDYSSGDSPLYQTGSGRWNTGSAGWRWHQIYRYYTGV